MSSFENDNNSQNPPKTKRKRVFQSGCQKRKEATQKQLLAAGSSSRKITTFFSNKTKSDSSESFAFKVLQDDNKMEILDSESENTLHPQISSTLVTDLRPQISDSDNSTDSKSEAEEIHPGEISVNINMFNDINLFVAPSNQVTIEEKLHFLRKHPIQPTHAEYAKLPFKPIIYKRELPNGEYVTRNWLSYSIQLKKLF